MYNVHRRARVIQREFYTTSAASNDKDNEKQDVDGGEAKRNQDETSANMQDNEEALMQQMLGFSSFDTTKGKAVADKPDGCVDIVKRQTYRQYMNRKGGFNRPLDKVD